MYSAISAPREQLASNYQSKNYITKESGKQKVIFTSISHFKITFLNNLVYSELIWQVGEKLLRKALKHRFIYDTTSRHAGKYE